MNLKKALQAFLVTISCGMLNVAGAQQRPVFIPEDYVTEQAQADFVANGPKLLFSDSPETVYRNGILYRDKVEGDVRLFLHHVNGVAGKKKLAEVRANELPALIEKAKKSGLPEDAQAAKDLDDMCTRFEKKLYDLELTRNIAQRFNGIYGDVFTVPEGYFGKVGSRIMSLQDPSRKMSKSDPEETFISLLDPPDAIRRKVKRAVTDSEADIRFDPENKPGVSNLLSIIAALTGQSVEEAAAELQGQGYGKLKDRVSECVIETLAPLQSEHKRLMADKAYLQGVLAENAEIANRMALRTLRKVQRKVGFAERLK